MERNGLISLFSDLSETTQISLSSLFELIFTHSRMKILACNSSDCAGRDVLWHY